MVRHSTEMHYIPYNIAIFVFVYIWMKAKKWSHFHLD